MEDLQLNFSPSILEHSNNLLFYDQEGLSSVIDDRGTTFLSFLPLTLWMHLLTYSTHSFAVNSSFKILRIPTQNTAS